MNRRLQLQKNTDQDQINQLNQKLSNAPANTNSTAVNLKNFTTKYEVLSFEYPATFTLTDGTKANPDGPTPGTDVVTLTSPNGFYTTIQTGLYGVGGGCEKCKVLKSDPVTVLGKQYYINYVSSDGGPTVDYLVIGDTPTGIITFLKGKNVTVDGTPTLISVRAGYSSGEKQIPKTLAELQSDPNIATFKQILQSFSY
jgi:hypothetical protein